jgi:hypothetical protein
LTVKIDTYLPSTPDNFVPNPEALLRKKETRASTSFATPPITEPLISVPATTNTMAQKSLREFSVLAIPNVPTGPAVNIGDKNFKLRTRLITMVQASPFYGLPSEDANAHLQHFIELCDTIVIKDVTPKAIGLRLSPFSLMGKAK